MDWGNLSESAKHTLSVLLRVAKASDYGELGRVLSNLTEMDLRGNQIVDISPLQSLSNLTDLYLRGNQIVDISPLKSLSNLMEMDLSSNQIVDISPLKSLSSLTVLYLDSNQIVDISPLQSLSSLTVLYLGRNQIVDISPLKSLQNLTVLDLGDNQIADISPLQSLSNLTVLDLGDNQIADIGLLKSLPLLERIWIYNCYLPRKYFCSPEQLDPRWLLAESNAEIRRALILMIGYERICQELKAKELDSWREYVLLEIQNVDVEPVHLLKMNCPSTGHVHVLRVPPAINLAREAISWVNWGVDPQDFSVET